MSRRKKGKLFSYDEVRDEPPTRHRHIALRDGRPLIPRCQHQGCTRDAHYTKGARQRTTMLCREHVHHDDYDKLRTLNRCPLLYLVTRK